MKKTFSFIIIIIILVFAGMQYANAQKTVVVPFIEEECDCPGLAEFIYRVDIEVIDQCGEDHYTIYADFQFVSQSPATFALQRFCNNTSNEECYLLVAAVSKFCSDGNGGYTEVCSGKYEGDHYSCPFLMSSGTIIIPTITID